MNHLNLTFQKCFVDIGRSYDDICSLFIFLATKIMNTDIISKGFNVIRENINNNDAYNSLDGCDFGLEYNKILKSPKTKPNDIITLEQKAFTFIKSFIFELNKRLPDNLEFFQKLQLFSPNNCLNQLHPKFSEFPFIYQLLNTSLLTIVETQLEKLTTIKWTSHLSDDEMSDRLKCWPKLYSFACRWYIYF